MRMVFSILLLFFNVVAQAQSHLIFFADVDSLKKAETKAKDDTSKVFIYTNLSFAYLYLNPNTSIRYATKGFELAQRLDFVKGEVLPQVFMGEAIAFQGNLAEGLKLKLEALQKAEAVGDSALLIFCYNFIGANYVYSNDYETALQYYNNVKAYSNLTLGQSKYLFGQIGTCCLQLNKLDSAYYYTKLAYDLDVKVFDLSYTRFNDLKQVEAQAKEAVRQAALDRVRAEIASMRTTTDLERITPLIWKELTILYVPFIRCGVFTMHEAEQQAEVYLSTPSGEAIAVFHLPFSNRCFMESILRYWRNKQMFTDHWDAATFSGWTKSLVEHGVIQADAKYGKEIPPENLYLHFLPFMQGMLYVGSSAPLLNDDLSLVQALAEAFSTAYARYEDFSKLNAAKQQVETTLKELRSTQAQLTQKEKMASLGELTAGIAHEIQNPLNFVNNFSETNVELLLELKEEIGKGNTEEASAIASDAIENEQKINQHGKRAEAIVKSMLEHSHTSKGEKQPIDINALVDEYLRLAYHGFRAKDKNFNVTIETSLDEAISKINLVPQDFCRVLLNLFNNAFYAVNEKQKHTSNCFIPTVSVRTIRHDNSTEIIVCDNGNGIPQQAIAKIFQPFFTTKPTGEGTGLGLSLSYDIVTAHGGALKVESTDGNGTAFTITLPILKEL